MGLAEALLGQNNPFAKWAGGNSNLLASIGAGLASGPDLASGIGAGLRGVPQAKMLDMQVAQQQEEKAKKNQTVEYLKQKFPDLGAALDNGAPIGEVWNEALNRLKPQGGADPTANMRDFQFAQDNPGYAEFLHPQGGGDISSTAAGRQELAKQYNLQGEDAQMYVLTGKLPGSNQSVRAGVGQPLFGKNKKTGAIEPWQSMTDGTMINTANPQANPAEYDFNPGVASGARAEGTVDAKTAGAARAALPGMEVANNITRKAIEEIRNNQAGMKEWFGQVGPRGMYINPSSEMGKFAAATGPTNAAAFMQARNMLKGGGQITDYEGRRGEDAYSRMQASLETGDQASYLRALSDFEAAVTDGFAKLQATAQGGYSAGSPAISGGSGNQTSTGVQWSVSP